MAQSMLRFSVPGDQALPVSAASTTAVTVLRGALIVGCATTVGIASWLGDPRVYVQADPALARLLRGMALIKGTIALAAIGLVYWRLTWHTSKLVSAGYLVLSWALAGSTMLIWQLSYLVPAALTFHAATLSLLLVGWRERQD